MLGNAKSRSGRGDQGRSVPWKGCGGFDDVVAGADESGWMKDEDWQLSKIT